ncbi:MAG TPA: LysR family transcriptional regulator [Desulfonatronum sp.]|nr:LysR family transcriptional regulator [Desulfonatronum sp.]
MDVRQLRAFAKVYERKSFSKAAEDLFLSQPTISAHIAALEGELKVPLFDRLGRGIMPTPAADVLYAYCSQVFRAMEEAEAEIRLLSNEVSGRLVLGGSTIPANYFLPDLVSRFLRNHPGVSFSLEESDSSGVIQGVLNGQLALGVVGAKEEHLELDYVPLFEDSLVVLASAEHVQDAGRRLSLDEACGLPWVVRQPGSGTRRAMEKAFEDAGRDHRRLRVASVVDSTEALLRFVRCGLGLTVSSRLAAGESLQRGELMILDVPELHLQRSFFAVFHRQRHQFPATRYFLEFLLEQASSLGVSTRTT